MESAGCSCLPDFGSNSKFDWDSADLDCLVFCFFEYSTATAQTLVGARNRYVQISSRLLAENYLRKDYNPIAADGQNLSVLLTAY